MGSSAVRALASVQTGALTLYSIPVTVAGSLQVQFQGDPDATCATTGQCGYSGTVSWTPPTSGELDVAMIRSGHHLQYGADLQFPGPLTVGTSVRPAQSTPTGGTTAAQVTWTPGPGLTPDTCADTGTSIVDVKLPESAGQFQFSLAQASPDLILTRCAGPTIADIAHALNPPELPISALIRGNTTVDLSADGNFTADGLTGTASSTIVLTLGAPQRTSLTSTGATPSNKLVEARAVTVNYRAALSGTVTERITADTLAATCGPLGACGQSGQLTFQLSGEAGKAVFEAVGKASLPLPDYLSALGQRRGPTHKLFVLGTASFQGDGTLSSSVQEGGSSCADTVAVPQIGSLIARSGNRVGVALLVAGGGDATAGRTRCPGPILPAQDELAGAVVRVGALRRHVVTIELNSSVSLADGGYTVELIPNLTLRLRRTGISIKTAKVAASLLGSG